MNTEHYDDGKREHEDANYEGTAFQCGCGERFVEYGELVEHVAEHAQ